jgi:hypothetical protein
MSTSSDIDANDMQDKISDLPVFGDTIYSPELFSDPNKTVESDDNLSNEDVNNNITVAVTPTKVIPMYLQQN